MNLSHIFLSESLYFMYVIFCDNKFCNLIVCSVQKHFIISLLTFASTPEFFFYKKKVMIIPRSPNSRKTLLYRLHDSSALTSAFQAEEL